MAAIIHTDLHPTPAATKRRPSLTLLEGGRLSAEVGESRQPRREATDRLPLVGMARRNLAVLGLSLAALVGIWSLVAPPAHSGVSPQREALGLDAAGTRPIESGDTLWGIARSLRPSGDVRDVVDRLAEVNGGYDLVVGRQLRIPSDLVG